MRTILQLSKPLFLHSLSLSSPRRRYRRHPVCTVSFIVTFITINLWKRQQSPPLDESSDLEDCRRKLVHLLVVVVLLLLGSKGLHLLLDVIRDTMRVFEQVGLVPKNGEKDLAQKRGEMTWTFFVLPPYHSPLPPRHRSGPRHLDRCLHR